MTEKTKTTTWKAIVAVAGVLIAAITAYAALVQADILDNPRAAKTETTAEPTAMQAGADPIDPTNRTGPQLAVGDITHFGQYDWRVLDVQGGKALLLSEDILEMRPYNTEYTDVTWETCTLRAYLNGEFYNKFNEAERSRIAPTRNDNPDNTWGTYHGEHFNTPGGNPTDDHVSLLSVPEILKYFPGLKLHRDSDGNEWYYEPDERFVAKFNSSRHWWWLRSPGIYQNYAAGVYDDGGVSLYGDYVDIEGGVRPALWLNLES